MGGWVRDMLMLGRPSRPEIDLAVEGDAILWGRKISESLGVPVVSESPFGTSRLHFPHRNISIRVDIASCRKDQYPIPGGMPVVSPSPIGEDLFRRDFTVNAMALLLPFPPGNGLELLDPAGGKEDLARKQLRILYPESFRDDPARMFRMFRFQERLGFGLSPSASQSLLEARKKGFLLQASKSRIWEEVRHAVLEEARKSIALRWLEEAPWGNLLPSLHPSSLRRKRVFAWDRFLRHEKYFSSMGKYWPECLLLLAIFYGLPRGECRKAVDVFGVPVKVARTVMNTLFGSEGEDLLADTGSNRKKKENRNAPFVGMTPQQVFLAAILSGGELLDWWDHFFAIAETKQEPLFLISGDDLAKEGILPSPFLGEILREVWQLQENGILKSKKDTVLWIRQQKIWPPRLL
ncbi:MAG: tRNA nucleotidyltransferase/poly(A) polymerase family protein [Leptospirillum sp.]